MVQVDRRQMLAASAALGLTVAAGPDPAHALPALAEDRLRFWELPCDVRRSMARHWMLWPILREGWKFFPEPSSAAALDAAAQALEPAFEAGARHGYFFCRRAEGRLPAALFDAVLAVYPHLSSERGTLDERLRAVVAWAEWDGYFYRGQRTAPVLPVAAARPVPTVERATSDFAVPRKTYRLGNQFALFGSLGMADDE